MNAVDSILVFLDVFTCGKLVCSSDLDRTSAENELIKSLLFMVLI